MSSQPIVLTKQFAKLNCEIKNTAIISALAVLAVSQALFLILVGKRSTTGGELQNIWADILLTAEVKFTFIFWATRIKTSVQSQNFFLITE